MTKTECLEVFNKGKVNVKFTLDKIPVLHLNIEYIYIKLYNNYEMVYIC